MAVPLLPFNQYQGRPTMSEPPPLLVGHTEIPQDQDKLQFTEEKKIKNIVTFNVYILVHRLV